MASFQTFQREVNFLKNIYFFIFFIVLILFIYFQFISESLSAYKISNTQDKKSMEYLRIIEAEHASILGMMSAKQKKHSKYLAMSKNSFNPILLSRLLAKYFTTFDVKEQTNAIKEDTHEYVKIKVVAQTTIPKNFYNFMEGIKDLENIVEVIYPIEFDAKDGYLQVKFQLKFYVLY